MSGSIPARQPPPALWLALALAAAGGYADCAIYLLAGAFTGHITGNSVLAAVHLAANDRSAGLLDLVAVAVFLSASFVSMLIHDSFRRRLSVPFLAAILFAEAALLLPLALLLLTGQTPPRTLCILLGCSALGIQNGTLTRLGQISVHTTFLTGMVTSLIKDQADRLRTNRPIRPPADAVTLKIWTTFLLGALAAAFLQVKAPRILILPLVLALIATGSLELRLRTTG